MAKHAANHAFNLTKSRAGKEVLKDPSSSRSDVLCLVKYIRHGNLVISGEKLVHNDAVYVRQSKPWNVDFDWVTNFLTNIFPMEHHISTLYFSRLLLLCKSDKFTEVTKGRMLLPLLIAYHLILPWLAWTQLRLSHSNYIKRLFMLHYTVFPPTDGL